MIHRRKRVLIFGCGAAGQRAFAENRRRYDIIGFLDNNPALHHTRLLGLPIHSPAELSMLPYERILIASMYHREIRRQLLQDLGVSRGRVEVYDPANAAREQASRRVLRLMQTRVPGVRPILLLEEYQWAWTKLRVNDVFREGLRRGLWFAWHEVTSLDREPSSVPAVVPEENYRGVQLYSAVAYSVCVELEVAASEFDWANSQHQAAAARWFAIGRAVVDELHEVLQHFRPRAIVGMQGYFVSTAVARQLAPVYGFQFFALENTFCQGRFICEPMSGIAVNRTAAPLFFRQREDLLPPARYEPWLDHFLATLDGTKSRDHASPTVAYPWPAGRKRIVFLGQCYTDSSLLFGARDGATAVTILRTLLKFVDRHPAFLLAKLHPKEKNGINTLWMPYNRLTWRKMTADPLLASRLGERGPETVWDVDEDNRFSTAALLQESDVVVTINSQGGLEALGYGKNVVLLGDAFYGNLGFTFEVPRLAVLPAILHAILFEGVSLVDREALARFLYVYLHDYCVERSAAAFVSAIKHRSYPAGGFAAAFALPSSPPLAVPVGARPNLS